MKYFVKVYQERLNDGTRRRLDIKWDRELGELFNQKDKEHVIDLLQRVCTVSVETMHIIHPMLDTVEHQGEA